MDKCREEFEIIARKNEWNLTTYPEITGRVDYVNKLIEQAWQMFQHQQAKVEELQKRVGVALELMQKPVIVGEPSIYLCERFKELEQALKGEV